MYIQLTTKGVGRVFRMTDKETGEDPLKSKKIKYLDEDEMIRDGWMVD